MSRARAALVAEIAREIATRDARFVAVDGVDGAGKTWFADELAAALGRRAVRVSIDGFHRPRAERYARGRESPEGFFLDSYDYRSFTALVLDSFPSYTPAIHDVASDAALEREELVADADAILVVDGIFLHRDELVARWDYSIWLDVPFEVSIPRGAARGPEFGSDDPHAPSNRRYVDGQRLYMACCAPQKRATRVIDNRNLDAPRRLEVSDTGGV